MLTAIEEETLYWHCQVYDEYGDLSSCGEMKQAHISEARYLLHEQRGAVIALPRCTCGAQMFLKADYRIRDVWHCCMPVVNEQGETWAYAMTLGHVRNLMTHWMLYERGEADVAPCIEKPPVGGRIEGVPHEVFVSLWCASLAHAQVASTLETTQRRLLI